MIRRLKNIARSILLPGESTSEDLIAVYINNGRIPWSKGYWEYKRAYIMEAINSPEKLACFTRRELPADFGIGIDERSVEYPWLFSRLSDNSSFLLDAGSTFNFDFIVEHPKIKKKSLTIYTFFPENNCFFNKKISYVYGDLRELYFKDEVFEEIVCQSTLEHISMDNSMYGYQDNKTNAEKSYEYLKAVSELIRVLKPGGRLLITFPYGKYEYHGFFQQFDMEMLQQLLDLFKGIGVVATDYFKYEKSGWRFSERSELSSVGSYNPHSGKGKGDDGAAHCRSIACIEFIKNI